MNGEANALVLKTKGQDVFLVEQGTRGTLCAVYELLEAHLGVGWWTKTEEQVPTNTNLTVPPLDPVYAPVPQYRDPYYWEFTT